MHRYNVIPPSAKSHTPRLSPAGLGGLILALALVLAGTTEAYRFSEQKGFAQLDDVAYRQLDLYASTLENELGKHAYLPSLIALDQDVLGLFKGGAHAPTSDTVNRKLANLSVRAGAMAIFLTTPEGHVLAASEGKNVRPASSEHLLSLPFFVEALRAQKNQFFAASPESGASEYYFAHPLMHGEKRLGLIGVKISLDPLEATWVDLGVRSESEDILVLDDNGVVILSSVPEWKYRTLTVLPPAQMQRLDALGKYPPQAIKAIGLAVEKTIELGAKLVTLPATAGVPQTVRRVLQERPMAQLGWRLVILSDPANVWRNARYAAWGGGAITAFLCLLIIYLRQRRRAMRAVFKARNALQQVNGQLEAIVTQRTQELRQANQELLSEIQERHLAEEELVQSGKLAVLGQMSAGISHEINQPLTALRALSTNTVTLLHKGRMPEALDNLKAISDVAERMGRITAQLKSFARKGHLQSNSVALHQAIANVQLLLEHRTRHEQVSVQVDASDLPCAQCDANRLEQVLINLSTNALDAMANAPVKVLSIKAKIRNGRILVSVADTGPVVPDTVLQRLFEPFFSTKPAGEGLGLGLVISSNIVKEFGGELRVHQAQAGLVFEFDLEVSPGERYV
jgi:two-component system, NtrC family, C4-dicarboxylate transport sensor histidine kinase DctB